MSTKIFLITNDDEHNKIFINSLERRLEENNTKQNTIILPDQDLHEKGILNDHGSLSGSMNITYKGLKINSESILYTISKREIDEYKLNLKSRYLKEK